MKRMCFQTTVRIILSTTFAPVLSTAHALADDSSLTTWNVSADGSDANPGSAMKPFRTITRGAEAAKPGDTVLVHPGVYRERVSPPRGGAPGKPITYRADKLGMVFIRGSEPWNPAWKAEGAGIFSAVPDKELFTTDNCYVDDANPFRVELASTPYDRQGKPEAA